MELKDFWARYDVNKSKRGNFPSFIQEEETTPSDKGLPFLGGLQ